YTSLGGLAGCPYAAGAARNFATNVVLYLLQGLDIQTDVDSPQLQEETKFSQSALNKKLPRRTFTAKLSEEKQKERFEKYEQDAAPEPNEAYPQRKREMIYFFIKNQYDRFRSKAE